MTVGGVIGFPLLNQPLALGIRHLVSSCHHVTTSIEIEELRESSYDFSFEAPSQIYFRQKLMSWHNGQEELSVTLNHFWNPVPIFFFCVCRLVFAVLATGVEAFRRYCYSSLLS